MKSFFFKYLIILLFCMTVVPLKSGTSPFSALSFGDFEPTIALTPGTAVSDSLNLSAHNYATWSCLVNTTFSVKSSYYLHNLKQNGGLSSEYDRFSFEEILFAMPFAEKHFIGFSYYPVAVSENSAVSDMSELVNSFEHTKTRTLQTRKGSIANASLIYGFSAAGLSVATGASFRFGNYDITSRYHYASYWDPDFSNLNWEKFYERKDITGFAHFTPDLSLFYKSPYGLDAGAKISFPVATSYSNKSSFKRTTSFGTILEDISESDVSSKDSDWPVELAFGVSYSISKLRFAYDYSSMFFRGTDTRLDSTILNDRIRHSAGFQFRASTRIFDPYHKRITYSGSVSYEKRPYNFNGNDIHDVSQSVGLSLPFNNDRSAIDITMSHTSSGSLSDNGMEGRSFRITFGFISSDRWKIRKERYAD